MLSETIKEKIKSHALEDASRECCGFVVGEETFRCRNYSEKPKRHFNISPHEYLKASRKGAIKAVYHSHVSGKPSFSVYDKQASHNHNLKFLMYHNPTGGFFTYDPAKEKTVQVNKKFILGESDCYTLVKDYYKELGIELAGKNTLGHDWVDENPHLIQDLFDLNKSNPTLPITELHKETPLEKHDVIVFEMIKGIGPCHVGIYLGNESLYHHQRNKFPTVEKLNKTIKNKIYKIYRHTALNEQS